MFTPIVIEKTGQGERSYDIYSRLLKDRIIMLNGEVNDAVSASIVAQLLFLNSENPERPIYFYINSPGGVITSGMAIYDTMNFISSPVYTYCIGQAASMGSFLLAAGEKGFRFSLPSSRIMIHQPLGGAQGQATDIDIQAKEILRIKKDLNTKLSLFTGKDLKTIEKDTERDNFMSAKQALEYGLIDKIIEKMR